STDGRLHVAGDHPPAGVESGAGNPGPVVACVPLRLETRKIGAIGLGLPGGALVSPRQLDAVATLVAGAVHTARTANRLADIGVLEERRRIAREMHDGLAQTLADAMPQTHPSAMTAQGNPAEVGGDPNEPGTPLARATRALRRQTSELPRDARAWAWSRRERGPPWWVGSLRSTPLRGTARPLRYGFPSGGKHRVSPVFPVSTVSLIGHSALSHGVSKLQDNWQVDCEDWGD